MLKLQKKLQTGRINDKGDKHPETANGDNCDFYCASGGTLGHRHNRHRDSELIEAWVCEDAAEPEKLRKAQKELVNPPDYMGEMVRWFDRYLVKM